MRYETFLRPEELRWDKWIKRQAARLESVLDDLEKNWMDDLAGIHVGSIGIGVALSYLDFRYPDMNWRDNRPKLAAFEAEFSARASMVATVPT